MHQEDQRPDNLDMLTSADICDRLKIRPRTLQTWRQKGQFPEPDLVLGKTIRWLRTTVETWLEENRSQRRGASPKN